MTKQEARTKWCPMARVYSPDGAYNKEGGCLAHGSTCIASDCMAWTWDETEYEYSGGQCPFYEDCDDETCVNIRKVLLNASDNSKGEVKP